MSVKIQPLGARVLLERLKVEEEQTKSGIYIPTRGEDPTYKCLVREKGELESEVQVGDVVLVTQYAGDAVKDGSVTYYLVEEKDILAVLRAKG